MTDYPINYVSPKPFGQRVEDRLKEEGRSKKWLAKLLDVSRQTLYIKIKYNDFKEEEKNKLKLTLGV